jgi:phosphatidylserine decarboxylase
MSLARQEARRFLYPLHFLNLVFFLGVLADMAALNGLVTTWTAPDWLWPWALAGFLVSLSLTFFVVFFFRDPIRILPDNDPHLIISAADGVVVSVEEYDEPDFHLGPMHRIAVFLSVLDVHVNRCPVDATVKSTVYRAGRFLDARHLDASTANECRAWWLESPRGPVVVRQIAGLIARRIVAWAHEGSVLRRGEHLGMIRFGSRTEVFVPIECAVLVKPGDRVAGAHTPIARWPDGA